jgi:hypothetical protein
MRTGLWRAIEFRESGTAAADALVWLAITTPPAAAGGRAR